MTSITFHIQKSCKLVCLALFFAISALGCSSGTSSVVGVINFDDDTVPFLNTSCSVGFTVVNTSDRNYTLAFLTGSFDDANAQIYQVEFSAEEVADIFDPPTLPALGTANANATFDLTGSGLTPPLLATMIVVGIDGDQVAHFVGNFTCQ